MGEITYGIGRIPSHAWVNLPLAVKDGVLVGIGYNGWPADLRQQAEESLKGYRSNDAAED